MILTKTFTYRGKQVTYDMLKPHSMLPVEVKCDKCGKVFSTTKYQLTRNGHEYCQACALSVKFSKPLPIGYKINRLTVIAPSARSGYSLFRCDCGKEKEINNWQVANGHTKSCGCLQIEKASKTAREVLSKYASGENNWNWKGGISPERNCIEKTAAYINWRKAVFEKYSYKCVKCGSTENLVTHHICNFVDYPSLRTDIENGACLCENCHRLFHNKYGLANTTTEQFHEFLNS